MDPISKTYVSACVQIQHLWRTIFLLPRKTFLSDPTKPVICNDDQEDDSTDEPVNHVDDEFFNVVAAKFNIKVFHSRCVDKLYAFEYENVPAHGTYLEVKYPASDPQLPINLNGDTFSQVFGTSQSVLEQFLLQHGIHGPGWINIDKNYIIHMGTARALPLDMVELFPANHPGLVCDRRSHCKREQSLYASECHKALKFMKPETNPPPPPPLVGCSIHIKTIIDPKTTMHHIVAATIVTHNKILLDKSTPEFEESSTSKLPKSLLESTTFICPSNSSTPLPLDFQRQTSSHLSSVRNVTIVDSENQLLRAFIQHISKIDPDIILAHNLYGFHLDIILGRLQKHNIKNWSVLGRLKQRKIQDCRSSSSALTQYKALIGRIPIDSYISCQEFLSEASYSLGNLAKSQLNIDFQEIDFASVSHHFENSEKLVALLLDCQFVANLAFKLVFHLLLIPLTHSLTQLGGNQWHNTLLSKRAERIAYLLLHTFYRKNYILPDPIDKKAKDLFSDSVVKSTSKGSQYEGGKVLEPKSGLYDTFVLVLDFNSLYPSIIQEFNLCFTTVKRKLYPSVESYVTKSLEYDAPAPVPLSSSGPGILPQIIGGLVGKRTKVKQLLKKAENPQDKFRFNIQQLALKITANAMYGCLGFSKSRFYAKPIAELITLQGRTILEKTVELVNGLHYNVVYGDTDSIMIDTGKRDLHSIPKIASSIIDAVNKNYSKIVIDIEGVYKTLLLYRKKKYAALMIKDLGKSGIKSMEESTTNTVRLVKGLDQVRRDWCNLSRETSDKVLTVILSGASRESVLLDILKILRQVGAGMDAMKPPNAKTDDNLDEVDDDDEEEEVKHETSSTPENILPIDPEKFVIRRVLTKDPHQYGDVAHHYPHVQVALKMEKRGVPIPVGHVVPYVICLPIEEEENKHPVDSQSQNKQKSNQDYIANCAYHISTFLRQRSKGKLFLDIEWYKKNQIFPPIKRLCSVIQQIAISQLAESLNIQSKQQSFIQGDLMNNDPLSFLDTDLQDSNQEEAIDDDSSEATKNLNLLWMLVAGSDRLSSRFAGCKLFQVCCPTCKLCLDFSKKFLRVNLKCPGKFQGKLCPATHTPASIYNQLFWQIREHIEEYAHFQCKCSECDLVTTQISLRSATTLYSTDSEIYTNCLLPNCSGYLTQKYSAGRLYLQLLLYQHQIIHALDFPNEGNLFDQLDDCKTLVSQVIAQCGFSNHSSFISSL